MEWLAEHLKDPDLVIFQIGDGASKRTYDAGHIPGAQFLNPFSELAAPNQGGAGLALELPAVAQLDSVLEAKGSATRAASSSTPPTNTSPPPPARSSRSSTLAWLDAW